MSGSRVSAQGFAGAAQAPVFAGAEIPLRKEMTAAEYGQGTDMEYGIMKEGVFLERPNRFLARVQIDGKEEICHVKNTGRCRELLRPSVRVWCEQADNSKRKTRYSLVKVEKDGQIVNMDSQAPNKAALEWVAAGGLGFMPERIQPEVRCGDSRLDLYFEHAGAGAFMEVKGVTLESGGAARFPDAPTQRGAKHLRLLQRIAEEGTQAYVLFVVQMRRVNSLSPNWQTDPVFSRALCDAAAAGVHVLAVCCDVTETGMRIAQRIPVVLAPPEQA